MTEQTIITLLNTAGLGAVVCYILLKWVCPKVDKVGEDLQALTVLLASHFQITPEQIKEAKDKLNGKK